MVLAEVEAAAGTRARLERIWEWYRGMIHPSTGRLAYLYDPVRDVRVAAGEPVRDIAAAYDVARLGRFLGRTDLAPLVERTLQHWESRLVEEDGTVFVDTRPLGEPPGIAHAAFLLLGALEAGGHPDTVRRLTDALLRQQRPDGSLKVWFLDGDNLSLELCPAEALVALARVYEILGDGRCHDAMARGFDWFRAYHSLRHVDPDLLVFYATWQSQLMACLYHASDEGLRARVRDELFSLHDALLDVGFWEEVALHAEEQACVQVACGLEGVVEGYDVARAEGDARRVARYGAAGRVACRFLFHAQRLRGTPRERGGFGHSLEERAQRIDVTGHAAHGLMRAVEVGLVR
ncbi:MAG: hypothetical protein ACK4YP_05575 [Myxococcota bacterium]